MSRSITRPLGSIVLATLGIGVGAALAANVSLPRVDPQPFSGDVYAVQQHAGWNLEATVDPNQAQSAYVGWTTAVNSLQGNHDVEAGTQAVVVDGINVQVAELISAITASVDSVVGFTVNTALHTVNATTRSALQIVSNTESLAINTTKLALNTTNRALTITTGVANNAVALATNGISVNAALMGLSQSASTNRLNTGGTGAQTSGMADSGVGAAISSGSVSAAAGAAGMGAGASISLPRR